MKCKSCGAEISELNKFCGICGAANTDDTAEENIFPDVTVSDINTEDKNDEIDDILSKYGKSSEENGEDETTVPESAAREDFEGEDNKMNNENSEYLQQGEIPQNTNAQGSNAQNNNYQAGANPQYGGGNPNMPYNGYPQNGYYAPYGGGYPQAPFPAPYPQPYQQNVNNAEEGKKGRKTKQKRTVSVGVAVLCIIAVLILSAICGYLIETCFRNGINPFNFNKPNGMVLITENNISEEMQNG